MLIDGPQMVKDLRIGDQVGTTLAVFKKTLANYSPTSSRAGEQYLKLLLGDATGTIEARVWEGALEASKACEVDDVVWVEGTVVDYNGPQLTVRSLRRVPKDRVDPGRYRPCTTRDRQQMWTTLEQIIRGVTSSDIRKLLVGIFLEDTQLGRAFRIAPAGQRVHHAYVGGLLEHTLEVVELALTACRLHGDFLDRDHLLAGCLLHDIGKIREYDLDSLTFRLTDEGRLLGHVVLGENIVERRLWELGLAEGRMGLHLRHMILSHHGRREWGSPEVPKTPEACALFHADLFSARLNLFRGVAESHVDREVEWAPWDRYLERSIWVPQDSSGTRYS